MLRWPPIGREAADELAPLRLAERGCHARIWSESQDANVLGNPAWHIGLRPRLCLTRMRMGKANGEEAKMGIVVVEVQNVKIITIK